MNYYLGIDVSKGYADLVLIDENKGTIEKDFQLDDTFKGHTRLVNYIRDFFEIHPDAVIIAAVESTGGYENNWLNTLKKLTGKWNIFVARLNPKGVHHHSKAGLKRIITDNVSARNIAEYLINHPEKISFHFNDAYTPLRNQWNYIQMLSKQKVQLMNQLEKVLYRANPELLVYWKKKLPGWALQLLTLYPTAQRLSHAEADKLAHDIPPKK